MKTEQKLDEIASKLCDRYCIYTRIFSTEEEQEKLDDICKDCPMNGWFELLDRLPACAIGDKVWVVTEFDGEYIIDENKVNEAGAKGFFVSAFNPAGDDFGDYISYEKIGDTVFFDKQGAEDRIKERNKNGQKG